MIIFKEYPAQANELFIKAIDNFADDIDDNFVSACGYNAISYIGSITFC